MSRKDQRIESLFRNLAPPDPPPELRSQVLDPALEALQQPPPPDIWSHIWSSRPLRLVWSASFSVLVLCHLGLTLIRTSQHHPQQQGSLPTGTISAEEELAEVIDLPRLRTDVQPLGGGSQLPADEGDELTENTNNHSATDGASASTKETSA